MMKSSQVVKFTIYEPGLIEVVEMAKNKKLLSVLVINALQHYLASTKGKGFAKRLKEDPSLAVHEAAEQEAKEQGSSQTENKDPAPPKPLNIDSFLGGPAKSS